MKLTHLTFFLLAAGLGSTARAQFDSSRPAAVKAQAGVKAPAQKPPAVKLPNGAQQAQSSPQNSIAQLVGGNDDCAAADVIAGAGPFSVDTTAATTGADGQTEASCLFFATPGISNDVWFQWTAGASATTTLSLCAGTTGIDTKVAIYAGTGCPLPGTAIACNDDFCLLVTQVSWAATAGQTYTVQMGSFPGTPSYASSFTIVAAGAPPNDTCATPTAISGPGVFPLDTTNASDSLPNGVCATVNRDVWFAWTATSSGATILRTCGFVTADSVLAVWDSGACPPTSLVACNDDFCSLQSQLQFNAVSGTTYLFQLGAFGTTTTYSGSFEVALAAPPNADDCATPVALAGPGPYPFDNTLATTGAQGQTETACLFFGSTTIDRDVWFTWTAPSSGPFRIETCGQTGVDTKLAVYGGAGCPASAALVCNDDDCGLQSGASWTAAAGSTYTIQLGTFPGAVGGTGTFSIEPVVPASADDCATPTTVVGPGPFPFDNTSATTSPEGQGQAACSFFSSTTVDHDLWFCWTAPSSGTFEATTVGLTAVDTKLAVYDGCGCPVTAPLGCNDDSCGTLQSSAAFTATAGSTYTVQLGTFPGASGGVGQFDIRPVLASSACQYDDGTSENSIGLTAGGKTVWLQSFGTAGEQTLVSSISTAFGSPTFPGGTPPVGTPVDVLVWDDPNDDGDPIDCVLVFQGAGVIGNVDNNVFDTFPTGNQVLNGVFFVGVGVAHVAGQFPASMDTNSCLTSQPAWACGDSTGVVNYTNLGSNGVPPVNISAIFGGVLLLRAGCAQTAGTSFCGNADPNRIPCPCGNNGTNPNAGCANSLNAAGALLSTSGFTQNDSVVLTSTGMSGQVCVFFRTLGPAATSGVPFGDGVTCASGSLLRLRTVSFTLGSGTATFPQPGSSTTLSDRSGTFPGSGIPMWYGTYYRNAAPFCTPFTFNTSNTVRVDW